MWGLIWFGAQCVALVSTVGSVVSSQLFVLALVAYLLTYLISGFLQHGTPRWDKVYWARLTMDANLHYAVYCVAAMSLVRSLVVLAPLALYAAHQSARSLPRVIPSAGGLVQRWPLQGLLQSEAALMEMGARLEVGVALMQIVLLFLGRTGFMQVVMVWQFIGLRYALSPFTKATFVAIGSVVTPLMHRIPVLGGLWDKLTAWLISYATPTVVQQSGE